MNHFFMILLSMLLLIVDVNSWWQVGHMMTADIARLHISNNTYNKSMDLINKLDKDLMLNDTTFDLSSIWADEIKSHHIWKYNEYHFMDNPIIDPTYTGLKPNIPKYNILKAVSDITDKFKNKEIKDNLFKDDIWNIRLLIHFIGDMHQPLHVSSYYSSQFKKGDRGGNSFKIKDKKKNLHSYWDSSAGLFNIKDDIKGTYVHSKDGQDWIKKESLKLVKKSEINCNDYRYEKYTEDIFKEWIDETYEISKNYAYNGIKYNEELTEEYKNKAKKIVEDRLLKGGCRLAMLLNYIFE